MTSAATHDTAPPTRQPANAGQLLPPELLRREDVTALLRVCDDETDLGLRDMALIGVMYRGGLKLGEALSLRLRDVKLAERQLYVPSSRAPRDVGLDLETIEMLRRWIGFHEAHQLDPEALFCSLKGHRLHQSYVRTKLPRLAERAELKRRVHPQALRNTHAAELVLEGLPMPLIQEQLGLRGLGELERYLRQIELPLPDRVAAMQERRW